MDLKPNPIPTYGGDSVLRIPARDADESGFLSKLAHEFMEVQYAADDMPEEERIAFVTTKLKEIEVRENVSNPQTET